MRIVFAGTPDFAVPCLQALLDGPHTLVGVYTQPDRPSGRGRRLTASPVKQLAQAHDLPVYQPEHLKDSAAQAALRELQADLMVVVAYGLILPAEVLVIPTRGCINVHASLLPRWRGAAPIQRAILAGDAQTGISLMQMDVGLDTGPVLLERRLPIQAEDTGGSLHDKLATLGAEVLGEGVEQIHRGRHTPTPQATSGVTYADKLDKAEARIDWAQPADQIARLIRAFNPWPVAESRLGQTRIRIWQARAENASCTVTPGTILSTRADAIRVATGDGVLAIQQLQWPGGRPLDAGTARHGHDLDGQQFENA